MKRLLIAGYGDIARRAMPALGPRFEVRVLSRSNGMNLDRPESLTSLEPADAVLHSAPPPQTGEIDTRTRNLLAALESRRILPTRLVYISTSGVYGDCGGALVDESRAVNPQSARARRRVDAAGAAVFHERIATAGQRTPEAHSGRSAAISDGAGGASTAGIGT